MSSVETFEPRIATLEGQVFGHNIMVIDRMQQEIDELKIEIRDLIEQNQWLRDNHYLDMKNMVSDKLAYAVESIRNAVLDGSIGEMTDEDFATFMDVVSNTDIIPF